MKRCLKSPLLIGCDEKCRCFVYAGEVGTGFDESTLGDLGQRLCTLEQDRSPFVAKTSVNEERTGHSHALAEIAFTGWNQGGKLRHPSFVGLRQDKSPPEIEQPHEHLKGP